MDEWPRQLDQFHPATGLIKADYTDFVVEEVPLYPTDGVGTHTYFLIEKAGLSTPQAVHDVAHALNVRRHDIGFAGLKDARAVTRQWLSVEHIEPERVKALVLPRLRVLEVTRHRNKLRLGHLRGNHFVVKVRQTQPERAGELQDALAVLARSGVPNYFGMQRFGYRGDTWRIGHALVREREDEALDLLLGRPTAQDHGPIRQARKLYDAGKYAAAARTWPRLFQTERRALKVLARTGNRNRALAAIDKTTRNFYISAYQSRLFNQVVALRLPSGLGQLWTGDLAWLHASGAVLRVADAAAEQPRADALEISPTGPLFGYRMSAPDGQAARLEGDLFAREGLVPETLRGRRARVTGGRRPLRFPLGQAQLTLGADPRGPYLELEFTLPRGCYATALLRELFQLQPDSGPEVDGEETEVPRRE